VTSFLDMPGVALPTGADDAGVPTSLLVSLPARDDERLLALAASLESSLA
jgi:aspartyl-tRNA(Asn)/glutamyl-tRNA(Gln) amidotransferase subunit A